MSWNDPAGKHTTGHLPRLILSPKDSFPISNRNQDVRMAEITFSSPTLLSLFIYFWLLAVNGWDLFPNPSPVPLEAVVAPLLWCVPSKFFGQGWDSGICSAPFSVPAFVCAPPFPALHRHGNWELTEKVPKF